MLLYGQQTCILFLTEAQQENGFAYCSELAPIFEPVGNESIWIWDLLQPVERDVLETDAVSIALHPHSGESDRWGVRGDSSAILG